MWHRRADVPAHPLSLPSLPLSWPRFEKRAWSLAALPLLLFFLIPLVALLTRVSWPDLWASLSQSDVWQAVWLSLKTTTLSLALTIILGTPVALLLSRPFRAKRLVDTLVDLPTVLPPSVAGIALLMAFGRNGLIGSWLYGMGIQVAFTQTAVVMAQLFVAGSFYVRAASVGFAAMDPEVEQAALVDGASRWQYIWHVLLPSSRFALTSGAAMSWARALGEFGATILFAGNFIGRTQTMPLAIYLGFEVDLQQALVLSVILIGFSCLALLVVKGFLIARE